MQRPNILFIICDDLNHALPGHGRVPWAPTPHLSRLMADGVTFLNAQTNCPICTPARNALLSGLAPHRTGHYRLDEDWRANPLLRTSVMLPRHLRDHGYTVLGTGKVHHLGAGDASWWDDYGEGPDYGPFPWDGRSECWCPRADQAAWLENEYVSQYAREYDGRDTLFVRDRRLRFGWENTFGPLSDVPEWLPDPERGNPGYRGWRNQDNTPFRYISESDRDRMTDERAADWAVARLRERREGPFFLGVGFMRPHTPLYAPREYFDRFPLESLELPPVRENDLADCADALRRHCPYGFARFGVIRAGGEERWRRWLQAYLACIAFMDDQLGRILDALAAGPHADNTLVVFTSDNGYHMGEKEYLFKSSLWEESARVPLIVRGPGTSRGRTCTAPVSLVDLYPTFNEICDLPPAPHAQTHGQALSGHSLRGLLAAPEAGEWSGPPVALTSSKMLSGLHHSVRSVRHRYTLCEGGEEELYDHSADPYEWTNLASDQAHASVKAGLRRELERALAR